MKINIMVAAVAFLALLGCDNALYQAPTDPAYIDEIIYDLNPSFAGVSIQIIGSDEVLRKADNTPFTGNWAWFAPLSTTLNSNGDGTLTLSPKLRFNPGVSDGFKFAKFNDWNYEVGPDSNGGGNFKLSDVEGLVFNGSTYKLLVKTVEPGQKAKGKVKVQ